MSSTQMELANPRSELSLNYMLEIMPVAAYTCDASGLITHFNRHAVEVWGRTPSLNDPKDRWCGSFKLFSAAGEPLTHDQCWMAAAITDMRAYNGEEIIIERPNGERRFALAHANPFFAPNGRLMGAINMLVDITERKKAEIELQKAHQIAESASAFKSIFLANMSHEIRTPMTSILGYADVLIEDPAIKNSTPEVLDNLGTIKRNGEHLLAIINDILDVSKIEAGRMTVEKVLTRPEQMVNNVMSLLRIKAQAKGLTLQAQYDTAIPSVIETDPVRLRQILLNLVGNAIKFTEKGTITIRVGLQVSKQSQLRFDVVDTGIGMSPQQSRQIFKAFTQGDASTTRKFGGTGLGLHISKNLAEMLGGEISVRSVPGVGSTFSLTIATGVIEGCAMISPGENRVITYDVNNELTTLEQEMPLRDVRILLAEDGPDNQRLINFILKKYGAVVTTVENGKLAIELLTEDHTVEGNLINPPPFDLVLSDMQMPEMDGYTSTSILREKGSTLPILALTANAMSKDMQKCLAAGCDDYSSKPIDKAALINMCQRWLGKKGGQSIVTFPQNMAA